MKGREAPQVKDFLRFHKAFEEAASGFSTTKIMVLPMGLFQGRAIMERSEERRFPFQL